VSVEDERVLARVDDLRCVPAAVRFLSCEPLVGPVGALDLAGIDWVMVGGESAPGARPMQIEWVRELFRACRKSEAAFFFKQWGGVQKHRTGRELRGKTYDEMPVAKRRSDRLQAVAMPSDSLQPKSDCALPPDADSNLRSASLRRRFALSAVLRQRASRRSKLRAGLGEQLSVIGEIV